MVDTISLWSAIKPSSVAHKIAYRTLASNCMCIFFDYETIAIVNPTTYNNGTDLSLLRSEFITVTYIHMSASKAERERLHTLHIYFVVEVY